MLPPLLERTKACSPTSCKDRRLGNTACSAARAITTGKICWWIKILSIVLKSNPSTGCVHPSQCSKNILSRSGTEPSLESLGRQRRSQTKKSRFELLKTWEGIRAKLVLLNAAWPVLRNRPSRDFGNCTFFQAKAANASFRLLALSLRLLLYLLQVF